MDYFSVADGMLAVTSICLLGLLVGVCLGMMGKLK